MVINITQEQKEIIESRGLMVVQVKLWLQKDYNVCEKMRTFRKAILEAFNRFCEEVKKSIVEPLARALTPDLVLTFEPRKRYKIVKRLGLAYRVYLSRKGVYHCWNNC